MAYHDALTTAQMLRVIRNKLKREGYDEVAGLDEAGLCDELNAAARELTDTLVRVAAGELKYSVAVAVLQGAATLALPDGSNPLAPRVKRLLEAEFRVNATGSPIPLAVRDPRAFDVAGCWRQTPSAYVVVLENLTLRWLSELGAPSAGTVTLRYLGALPAATPGSGTPFDALPPECTDAILALAMARLLPMSNAARGEYRKSGLETLARQAAILQRRAAV